ncbi:MAG: M23 family metallopeptidase [Lachnospiraceae bacterium]|nr:M23 family metallopeptidase [Lachnospiraceae bacterium]
MDSVEKDAKKSSVCNILLVPEDGSQEVKKLHFTTKHVGLFCIAVVFLIVATLVYSIILTGELKSANDSVVNLQKQVTDLQSKNNELIEENDVLQEKVTILSDTVNDKVQKEAELAQNYIPKGFPLRGTAAYDEQTKTTSDNAPIAIFQASSGTPVIGTASGKVVEIAGDSVNGYIVKVDHGNGYISIYRNGSQVKVKEGDDITAATVIFEIEEGHEELGYQIMKDDEYIDPFEIIEING